MSVTVCLVFDFDGTILDTEGPDFCSWAEVWADHEQELLLSDWQLLIGTRSGFDPWAELEKRVGHTLDPGLRRERRARYHELVEHESLRPGVLDWLTEARSLGVPVGVASSSSIDWVRPHLERLGLLSLFSCLSCSDEPFSYVQPTFVSEGHEAHRLVPGAYVDLLGSLGDEWLHDNVSLRESGEALLGGLPDLLTAHVADFSLTTGQTRSRRARLLLTGVKPSLRALLAREAEPLVAWRSSWGQLVRRLVVTDPELGVAVERLLGEARVRVDREVAREALRVLGMICQRS